ncbi:MAG: LytR family transcriptional regulator [Gemmatimonadales bacterium]|nr:LytR family transcriptional regulator [Candidatus Palauibacter irciniicola]MYC19849.1 LytR family transcriptional regulator [Gemmatimonadales bacterium]
MTAEHGRWADGRTTGGDKVLSRSRRRSRRETRRGPEGRARYRRRQGAFQRVASAFRGLITTAILIGAGAFIGLFWEEWKVVRLAVLAGAGPVPAATAAGAGDEGSAATDSATGEIPGRGDLTDRIKVEVLNGAGERGLARQFADRLRVLGFDVVATGNAEHFDHEVTHVLDRSGRLGAALSVARELSADSLAVAIDPELYLDASVVVGSDWAGLLVNLGKD